MNSLRVVPIKACQAQECSCAFMAKPTTRLDVAWDMGVKALPLGRNPIYDGTFHSFGVISVGPIDTLLNLTEIVSANFVGWWAR